MTLEQRKKLAAHIQRILKVRRVSFPVANTEKGPLYLSYVKDAPDFEIVLDAVPLNMNDYDNRELKSLLEKYLFEIKTELIVPITQEIQEALVAIGAEAPTQLLKVETELQEIKDSSITQVTYNPKGKKLGRPAKSK